METSDSSLSTPGRIRSFAWAVALDAVAVDVARSSGRTYRSDQHQGLVSAGTERRASAWDELQKAGIASGPEAIHPSWHTAIAAHLNPAILIRMTSTWRSRSARLNLSIQGGRGLCVARLRRSGRSNGPAEYRDDVHVDLLPEERLWPTLRQRLPPVEALRAGASSAVDRRSSRLDPHTLTDAMEASLTASMVTRAHGRLSMWAGAWATTSNCLYSIRSDAARNTMRADPVPFGNIAYELSFALAGAHEFLAGTDRKAAR